ncbi:MAG: undecaprenyl-diphosphatase UppP [Acidobacteriota bacterium]
MDLWKALILGIIQGLTEFLPISSTAHLTLAGKLMQLIDSNHPEQWTAFIAVMQLGTLLAVLIYFARDLFDITREFIFDNFAYLRQREKPLSANARLGWYIIIGSLPIVIIGLSLKKLIEGTFTKNLYVIAGSLILLALLLSIAEIVGRRTRTIEQLTLFDSLVVGLAQVLALIPGSSRSGTTMTAALFTGLTRTTAARFSFLLSIPAIGGSGVYEFLKTFRDLTPEMSMALVVSTLASAVVGYLSIAFLIRYLQTHTTYIFVGYRIVLGVTIFILLLIGKVMPY